MIQRVSRRTLVLVLLSLAGGIAASAPAGAGAASTLRYSSRTLQVASTSGETTYSTNWAGYAVTGTEADGSTTQFTSISARWVQPRARCSRGNPAYSAFWIGLGGNSDQSQALEQIGTSADCTASGVRRNYMWYEIVPAPAVPLRLKVKPGNVVAASVAVSGTTVILQIRNLTRKTRTARRLQFPTPDLTSAEWIAETPSTCDSLGRCRTLPLANFGHVSFTRVATTTATGHSGTLTDGTWTATPIELVEDDPSLFPSVTGDLPSGAVPGAPSPDGTAFRVDWAKAVTPPPAP
jgi:hypothetical protein